MIVAFGPLHKAEFIAFFTRAMQATVPGFTPLPTDPPPLPFQVADPDALHGRLSDAGGGAPGAVLHADVNIGIGTVPRNDNETTP